MDSGTTSISLTAEARRQPLDSYISLRARLSSLKSGKVLSRFQRSKTFNYLSVVSLDYCLKFKAKSRMLCSLIRNLTTSINRAISLTKQRVLSPSKTSRSSPN